MRSRISLPTRTRTRAGTREAVSEVTTLGGSESRGQLVGTVCGFPVGGVLLRPVGVAVELQRDVVEGDVEGPDAQRPELLKLGDGRPKSACEL